MALDGQIGQQRAHLVRGELKRLAIQGGLKRTQELEHEACHRPSSPHLAERGHARSQVADAKPWFQIPFRRLSRAFEERLLL